MKYTNRADLLIAAGDSIKMQEKAGITPSVKVKGMVHKNLTTATLTLYPSEYEFPLAVVEGKPVFVGDELYIDDERFRAQSKDEFITRIINRYSWNQPKPKIVMVELLREDVNIVLGALSMYPLNAAINRAEEACRKALEKA